MMSLFPFCDLLNRLKLRPEGREKLAHFCSLMMIPSGVLSQYLFPFLKMKDVVRLDTAVLNRHQRPHFHESFVGTDVFIPRGVIQFVWFVARNRLTECLHLTRNCSVHEQSPIWNHVNMLKRLNVDRSAVVSLAILTKFLHSCCELESLFLCPGSMSRERGYNLLISSELKLTTIKLVYDYNPIPEPFLISLLLHCPRLQVLRLGRSSSTPMVSILYALAQYCPCLQELCAFHQFEYNMRLEEEHPLLLMEMQYEYEAALRGVLHHCKNLKTFGACMFTARGLMLEEDQVTLDLKHVMLQGSLGVQDSAVRNFVRCCPKIEHLDLTEFYRSTDECLFAVAEHLPLVHTLTISRLRAVTDAGVSAIRNACPRIKHLDLISGDEVRNLCLSQGPAGVLEHLDIYASRITDNALIRCAQHNHSLRVLKIYVWNMAAEGLGIGFRLSADTLGRMVSCLPQLEDFSFNSSHESQVYCYDGTLQALATYCPRLKILKLPQGNLITNAGLEKLGLLHCMQEIEMINCPNLANSALCTIAQGCPDLRTITMSACKLVNSVGIYALGHHCHRLRVLSASNCGWIRDYALVEVLNNATDLRVLYVDHGLLRGAAVKARIQRLKLAFY